MAGDVPQLHPHRWPRLRGQRNAPRGGSRPSRYGHRHPGKRALDLSLPV